MSERVFVSYEHQDRDFVSRLVPRLLDSGIPAWWDRETRLGEVWAEKLSQALGDCAAFLVVVRRALAGQQVGGGGVSRSADQKDGDRQP